MTRTEKFADNNGTRIHYTVDGDGPLIVAVHGFPDYHGSWDDLLPFLTDGYRVAAMDLRGYNLSDQPEETEAYHMRHLCADVAAVIAAEGERAAIVMGHDFGAAIAWQLAIHSPDLVRQLIILSVPHPRLFRDEIARNAQQRENSQYARAFQQEGSEDKLSADLLLDLVGLKDGPRREAYREAFERSSFRSMMNYYRMAYPRGTKPLPDDTPDLPKVKCPVLILHGLDDAALLPTGHNNSWEQVEQDMTLMTLPGAGHWLHHDRPDLVGGTIRAWLDLRKA